MGSVGQGMDREVAFSRGGVVRELASSAKVAQGPSSRVLDESGQLVKLAKETLEMARQRVGDLVGDGGVVTADKEMNVANFSGALGDTYSNLIAVRDCLAAIRIELNRI